MNSIVKDHVANNMADLRTRVYIWSLC